MVERLKIHAIVLKTQIIGKRFHHFSSLSSTNDYALSLITDQLPEEGTVITACVQHSGRGQRGAVWEGETDKNLYFSTILYPSWLPPRHSFALSQAVALAAAETVSLQIDEPVEIKWPNDVIVRRRKVGGILIQNGFQGSVWKFSVVGIGLNINQLGMGSVVPHAISLTDLTGVVYDLNDICLQLCQLLDVYYGRIMSGGYQGIRNEYEQRLFLKGEWSGYKIANGQRVEGCIEGVDDSGLLKVFIGGKLMRFDIKDISLIWEIE